MSRFGRSSEPNLGFFDDDPRRPVERWDRDKFERMRSRGPVEKERESFKFEERGRHGGGRDRRDVEVDERIDRRAGPTRTIERDRFYEDDRYPRSTRRPDFLDREERTPSEIANRALAPYRRKSIVEHDLEPPARLRPARPQFLRRQSSLDTFDRKPLPRYNERDRDDFRIPANVPVPLPIRRRSPSRRRRSPPRDRYFEEDYDEIKYRDLEPDYREEDYRDVRIRREKSTRRKSKSRSRYAASSRRSSSSSSSSFTEVSPVREVAGKKGKTRMPKRLVHRNAVVQLGYPFEEEEDFIIVRRALEKEQIDEIIKISETYKTENSRTTYKYGEKETVVEASPPPPPPIFEAPPPPPPPPQVVYAEPAPPPPPSVHYAPPPPQSVYAQSVRSASLPRREVFEERIEESNHIGGPLIMVVPDRHLRSERDIKDEIRQLELERRSLRIERDDRLIRETDYEVIERDRPKNVVRIEKDRKGRLALVRSTH